MRAKQLVALAALLGMLWAVPVLGTARSFAAANPQPVSQTTALLPARFRVDQDRGLLLTVWINNRGPFVLAVDTGAGTNLITQAVVSQSELATHNIRTVALGGLSGALTNTNREATITNLALGDRGNTLHSTKTALVVPSLASGLDGVLDPIDVYAPLGFSIDMPNRRIAPLDSVNDAFSHSMRGEGASVPWLRFGSGSRPFVRLGDGRLALVDTGSGFGLAVNGRDARIVGTRNERQSEQDTRDLGGGSISSRRVAPTTISIGELVLRGIPTDILYGITDDAPVILGRDALYPFKLTFNPQKRLIEFATSERI
ncbi:MAG TPA: hypothetical protein VLL54_04620 [Pyrinomonadaceae bacterium]|nr:hypothetical protein [Pyrinomonadaceae bacterium]